MPKYSLEIGGKTYDIESDKPLSDTDLASYASKIAAPAPQSRGTVPSEEPGMLKSIAAGIGRGVGEIGLGAQKLVGMGLEKLGAEEAGKFLQEDVAKGKKKLEAELAPYKAAYPTATGAAQFAGEMAATLPAGGLIAKPFQAIGAALPSVAKATTPLAQSIASGGFQTGLQPGVANMLTRAAGGATLGGASAALLNPEETGTGAMIGAALPGVSNVLAGARKLVRGTEQTPQMQAAIKSAREAGYVIPPSQARDSGINKALEGIAGKTSVSQAASSKNQAVTNRLANETIGLAPDVQLKPEVLDAVRAEAGKAYQAVSGLGDFPVTGGAKLPAEVNVKRVLDPYTMTTSNKVDSGELVRAWKQANADATAYYRAYGRDANPETLAKAKSAADTAKKVDQFLNDQLQKSGLDDMLAELKAARVQIAKTYSIENAFNPVTGNVDARKLAAQLQKGKPLSEGLETAGQFASQFKQSAQIPEQMGSIPGFSPLDVVMAGGASAALSSPAGALAAFTRPMTRAVSMSDIVQNRLLQKQQSDFYNKLIQGGPNYNIGTVQPLVERKQ
jgi:hypothetical protein